MSRLAVAGGARLVARGTIGPHWPIHGDEEVRRLSQVLHADVWGATGLGPQIEELNAAWAAYCGTRRSVALANGTVTLELALRALGVGPGHEVVVPAWTFMATIIPVLQVGATPVFCDVDPRSLCLSPAALEEALTARTRAVIPVHLAGHPCDMDAICEIAENHDLLVVEDAAQAHGAIFRGRKMGSFGHCGSYSFQQSKNLQCGEGGSVVTNDDDLADRLHFSLSKFGRGVRSKYEAFTHYELAGNSTMTEFQAAIVLAQLTRLEDQADRRHRNAALMRYSLSSIEGVEPLPVDPRVERHGCHLFLFRYEPHAFGGARREAFIRAMNAEGVPCSALYPRPLYQEPMYDLQKMTVLGSNLEIRTSPCPETGRASEEVVALPQWALLADEEELGLIAQAILKIQSNAKELAALPMD